VDYDNGVKNLVEIHKRVSDNKIATKPQKLEERIWIN
jgi:hypothetical protein